MKNIELKLTKAERRAVFRGTLKVLRRPRKPEGEAAEKLVVSWSRGGRQILDRSEGTTIDIPREPRLWLTFKGWHLRAGNTEWETAVTIHDERETHRVLANGIGGTQREPGLKTRWGTQVIHSQGAVKVVEKHVPKRGEQQENWTPETERGYGGRNQMEVSAEGELVPALGVDDSALDAYAAAAEPESLSQRAKRRRAEKTATVQLRIQRQRDHTASAVSGGNHTHEF